MAAVFSRGDDAAIRSAAFAWLSQVTDGGERPVTFKQLTTGFRYGGDTVQLIGQKGIWKPRQLDLPIAIWTTAPKAGGVAPYEDEVTDDGLLRYRYEGTDPDGYRNRWLRQCRDRQVPLIYFHGIDKGVYLAVWPALVIEDLPNELSVMVALLDPGRIRPDLEVDVVEAAERRVYTRMTKQRLDQAVFRQRVLRAYRTSCAICSLRHGELLDAAHIIPYAESGPSSVRNGLALCKIHHAAYDHDILGVRPDGVVQLRHDLLDEIDGPMLRHGLQEVHGQPLIVPRRGADRPAGEFLERRWARFLSR